MYEIILFSGGTYRFNELIEIVEDVGGLILKKNQFHISRGTSYLAEEIQVMLIVPEMDKEIIKSLSYDIKGTIKKLDLSPSKKTNILTYLSVYDVLSLASAGITTKEIEDLMECPCPAQICLDHETETCVLDELEETLNQLCLQRIVKRQEVNGKIEYSLNMI